MLRIPFGEVEAYCRFHNFDYAKRIDFLIYIERMDNVFMEHQAKLQEEHERQSANKSASREKGRRRRGR